MQQVWGVSIFCLVVAKGITQAKKPTAWSMSNDTWGVITLARVPDIVKVCLGSTELEQSRLTSLLLADCKKVTTF